MTNGDPGIEAVEDLLTAAGNGKIVVVPRRRCHEQRVAGIEDRAVRSGHSGVASALAVT